MKGTSPWAIVLATFFMLITLSACSDVGGLPPTSTETTPAVSATQEATPAQSADLSSPTARSTRQAILEPEATRVPTQAVGGLSTATPLSGSEREAIFEEVWQTVADNYLYGDFHGVDWNALREEYRPRVMEAPTSSEFYSLISEMVGKLDDEHSRYISPEDAKEEDDLQSGENSYVGVGILSSYEESAAVVLLVFPDSPAEQAGLKRRDRITHVDGAQFDPNANAIRGPENSQVRLTVVSPGAQPRDETLTRRAVRGKISPSAYRLENEPNIGYILIPSLWADDMATQVESKLRELLSGPKLDGIIMDLRANEGGWRSVLTGILGQFVTGEVGSFYTQDRRYPLTIEQGKLYQRLRKIPLVVLVDKSSQSYAEVLAAALQASGRAKVIGTQSAGNTETVYPYDFNDGSRLWVAQEGFQLPNQDNLEGRGVIPDKVLDIEWIEYTEATDPHILEAINLVRR